MAPPRSCGRAVSLLVLLSLVAFPSLLVAQPTADPRVVEFEPSPDHDRIVDGVALVDRYALEFYTIGTNVLLQSIDVGKPAPGTNGLIRFEFAPQLGAWQVLGVVYEARVVALGPGGSTTSGSSNQFNFPNAPPTTPSPPGPVCSFTLTPPSIVVSTSATTGSFIVSTAEGCHWTAGSSAAWLTVTGGGSGVGTGTVGYSIAANSASTERLATITLGTSTFTVSQHGGCTYTLSPTSQGFNPPGGTMTITVTAPPGCAWTATRSGSWITILSGNSGNGNGSVRYRVSANGGSATRTGTLTIAGQAVTITQGASTAPNAPTGLVIVR